MDNKTNLCSHRTYIINKYHSQSTIGVVVLILTILKLI